MSHMSSLVMLSDAFFVPSNSSKCMHGDKDLVTSVSGHGKYFNSEETSVLLRQ